MIDNHVVIVSFPLLLDPLLDDLDVADLRPKRWEGWLAFTLLYFHWTSESGEHFI